MDTNNTNEKKLRGFALLDAATRSAISRKGGQRAHQLGLAHEYSTEEAIIAGSKGGLVTSAKKRAMKEKNGGLGKQEV